MLICIFILIGYGVFTENNIKAGNILLEYRGEFHLLKRSEQRENIRYNVVFYIFSKVENVVSNPFFLNLVNYLYA